MSSNINVRIQPAGNLELKPSSQVIIDTTADLNCQTNIDLNNNSILNATNINSTNVNATDVNATDVNATDVIIGSGGQLDMGGNTILKNSDDQIVNDGLPFVIRRFGDGEQTYYGVNTDQNCYNRLRTTRNNGTLGYLFYDDTGEITTFDCVSGFVYRLDRNPGRFEFIINPSNQYMMSINENGVGIGTSQNPSTTYELYVNGSINATGTITPFTGAHECAQHQPLDNKFAGFIIKTTGEYKGEVQLSDTHPYIELTDKEKDKTVFGVYNEHIIENIPEEKDEDGNIVKEAEIKQFTKINSLGEGALWVTNINGDIENGDYLTSSKLNGLAGKQDDDLLHNYTVAKATQTETFMDTTDMKYIKVFEDKYIIYDEPPILNDIDGIYLEVSQDFSQQPLLIGQIYKMKQIGCTYHCG